VIEGINTRFFRLTPRRRTLVRDVALYSVSLAGLFLFLTYTEYRWVLLAHRTEIYSGIIAVLFTLLGIWLATRLMQPKKEVVIVEREVHVVPPQEFSVNERELEKLGISRRELDVLELMAEGLSNQEIAGRLFVSVNTVKTHASSLLDKLQVQRRTMAVKKGRAAGIIR
jgi:two-component system, NarL family, response regulator LiaR